MTTGEPLDASILIIDFGDVVFAVSLGGSAKPASDGRLKTGRRG